MPISHLLSRGRIGAVAVMAAAAMTPGAVAQPATAAPDARAATAFERAAAVITHPRCENCHQREAPLQGDAARAHVPRVVRGADDAGAVGMRCSACHRDINNRDSGVPGAPHWQQAPVTMTWHGMTTAALCRALKDPALNGGRSLPALVEHVRTDALVLWSWNPGHGRTPVPLPHAEFVALVETWAAAGGPCPD